MLCGDTGKERSRVLVTGPRVFPFFFFFLPQYVFAFRCLGKTMCGFGSFSHWSMFWPRWLSAPRSTTWDASRWVSATTKLFCGCFLFEPLQVTSVAFGRTVMPVLWPALVFGVILSSPSPEAFPGLWSLCCCCFPDNGNQQDPFAVSCAVLQKGELDGVREEKVCWGAWFMCSAYKCFSFLFCSCLPQMALTQVTGSSSHSLKWLSSGGEAGGAWMCVEGGLVCRPGVGSWELKFVCQQFC